MNRERWRIWALTGGLLTALAVTGCAGKSGDDDDDDDDDSSGSSCTSLCKEVERAACPGSDTSTCAADCTKVDNLVKSAGCTKEWSDYLACYDDVTDKCDPNDTSCQAEATAWSQCLTIYCQDSAHTNECVAATSSSSSDS